MIYYTIQYSKYSIYFECFFKYLLHYYSNISVMGYNKIIDQLLYNYPFLG